MFLDIYDFISAVIQTSNINLYEWLLDEYPFDEIYEHPDFIFYLPFHYVEKILDDYKLDL